MQEFGFVLQRAQVSEMEQLRIAVDVGGTKIAYGLIDAHNNLLDRMQHPTPTEADGPTLSVCLAQNIQLLMEHHGLTTHDLEGVGVCMPSFILYEKRYIYMTSAMENVRDFPMGEHLEQLLGVPVYLDNDSNLAALAEHRFGAGRGSRHMVYMSVSTGIGSGLILNGTLFRGSYGWAGETGHMLITPDEGLLCGCRNQGCFMSWASGRYVPKHVRQMAETVPTAMDLSEEVDCKKLLDACRTNDPLALQMLDQMAHYLAVCLFNIYQILNINLFVFGGGLVHFGALLFDRVRQEFDRYNQIPMPIEFRFAQLEQDFGLYGAAELIWEERYHRNGAGNCL